MKNDGYMIDKRESLEALQILKHTPSDLIILDIMMPKMDGFEFCKQVCRNNHVPILMVSAKVEDMDKIIGLMTGADDYMIKPFNPLELTARVKALLHRVNYKKNEKDEDVLQVGPLVIDKESHTVTVEEKVIKVTAREIEILYLLASTKERVFASEDIFKRCGMNLVRGRIRT